MIGTLNEGPLHQALKALYARPGSQEEVSIDDFVADVVNGNQIIEIQTRGFGALKRKLPVFLSTHRVKLVHPIAQTRTIVKVQNDAETRRVSPKHGSPFDIFAELVYIPKILNDPNFEIDVVLIEEDEHREYNGRRGRRKGGWVTTGRHLVRVVEVVTVGSMEDLFGRVDTDLTVTFTSADLGRVMKRPRSLGQKAAYCFRVAGLTRVCGKNGNELVYEKSK